MTMTSTAWRIACFLACAMGLLSCSSNTTSNATALPSRAATTASQAANQDVTDRARAALTLAGAQRLVMEPGYEGEVNTAFRGVWHGYPLIAYVVPTSALPPSSELTVVNRRHISGQAVDVVNGEDSTVRMLRFVREPDTWLVSMRDSRQVSVALVRALLLP